MMVQSLTKRQEVALQRIGPVADIFEIVRDTARHYHPDLKYVGLQVDSSIHDSPRHFAMSVLDPAFPNEAMVKVAPELAEQSFDIIEGIIMHEFGHIASEWLLTGENVENDYDDRERQADRIAEEIFGVEIWYDSLDIERALPYGEPERGWTRPRRDGVR